MSNQHQKGNYEKELKQLLQDPENQRCADCGSRGPRWASYNLGVFLCISCGGIHRKLGTHISKVRSLTLDSWTPDQIQSMQQWGNVKANAHYCPRLDLFPAPHGSIGDMEMYIRDKYEYQKMKDAASSSSRFKLPQLDQRDVDRYHAEIEQLAQMGYLNRQLCVHALLKHSGNIQQAQDWLLQQQAAQKTEEHYQRRFDVTDTLPSKATLQVQLDAQPFVQDQQVGQFKFDSDVQNIGSTVQSNSFSPLATGQIQSYSQKNSLQNTNNDLLGLFDSQLSMQQPKEQVLRDIQPHLVQNSVGDTQFSQKQNIMALYGHGQSFQQQQFAPQFLQAGVFQQNFRQHQVANGLNQSSLHFINQPAQGSYNTQDLQQQQRQQQQGYQGQQFQPYQQSQTRARNANQNSYI